MRSGVFSSRTLVTYFIILPWITIVSIGMENYFKNSIQKIEQNILQSDLKKTRELATKLSLHLLEQTDKHLFHSLKSKPALRKKLEKEFNLLISSQYRYLYLLYFDHQGKLRYLLDAASDPEQRGEFQQRFGMHHPLWEQAQKSAQPQLITQDNIDELRATYLYPIKRNKKSVAILAIDFSYADYAAILKAIHPMEQFFFYFSLFLLLILLVAYGQLYHIYHGRKKSIIDPLTSVYNRVYMNEMLPKLNLENYALCMLDIDHFKHVNDRYGHGNGDLVLQEFARRVQNHVRGKSGDLLFRFGGEEFLLLLHKLDEKQTKNILNRLREEVKKRPIEIEHEKKCLHISLSIGCNLHPEESRNIEQATEIADQLLYQAKEQGRDRVILNPLNH